MVEQSKQDILAEYAEEIKLAELEAVRSQRLSALHREFWSPVKEALAELPTLETLKERNSAPLVVLNEAAVNIGQAEDLSATERGVLGSLIQRLCPWRKGPIRLFGEFIDSEWQSNRKWDRLKNCLPNLDGKRVLDIGCNNGYYLLRLLGHAKEHQEKPEFLLGIDPSESFYFAFQLLTRYLEAPSLQYELLGVEHVVSFPSFFDVIFCLGIVYHQRDPLTCLQGIRSSLRPGGLLILESQTIGGEEPIALFSPDRYAKARNVYFIPTAQCLAAWMMRAGFSEVKIVSDVPLAAEEQRKTAYAQYESLEDFLDPTDSTKTIEGYPAPRRAICVGRK